jgi:polyhydroxyalkanoate synthase
MPEATHLFYLREFYKNNCLSQGKLVLGDRKLDLSKVTIPIYLQSAKDDHIAPFRSIYKSTKLFGGPVRFIISGSGHIAGVINPPAAKKYQYWTNDTFGTTPDGKTGKAYPAKVEDWRAGAKETPGSWWPDWDAWLSRLSGPKVPARKPGDGKLKVLGDAPGTYVKVTAR